MLSAFGTQTSPGALAAGHPQARSPFFARAAFSLQLSRAARVLEA